MSPCTYSHIHVFTYSVLCALPHSLSVVCSVGDVSSGRDLLETMFAANPKILPNIRTVNTFLRGCLLAGERALAPYVNYSLTLDPPTSLSVSLSDSPLIHALTPSCLFSPSPWCVYTRIHNTVILFIPIHTHTQASCRTARRCWLTASPPLASRPTSAAGSTSSRYCARACA